MSNKAKGLALTFVIWILPAIAVAEMVSPWCGYGSVPEFGGAVGGASDIELNVGSKLVFDADADGNNYIYSSADTSMLFYLEGVRMVDLIANGWRIRSDLVGSYGNGDNYWQIYNSTGTQFELWSTNVDTFGADGLVFSVDDGTDDVDFSGSLGLNLTQKIYFDADEDSDTYIDGETVDRIRFISAGTARARFDPNNGFLIYDGQRISFGTGADQYLTYTDGTGVTWNDGTNTVLTVPDDTNAFNLGTGTNLGFGNAEFIHNDTDGKITLGGSGGTNNEDLIIDLESIADRVTFSSSTGVSRWDFTQTGSTLYGYTFASVTGYEAGSNFDVKWTSRTRLYSPVDGQLRIVNAGLTSGATLDIDDVANTLTIKDQAGTGNGNLTVTGDLTVDGDQTYYGSMYIASDQTIAMDASPADKQVGTFTAGADLNGTSFATNELTITNAGKYLVTASISSVLDTPGGDADVVDAYIYLDDGTPAAVTGCTTSRTYSGSGDIGSTSISCIASVAASDKIELWMKNTEDGTDVIVKYANVAVTKL